MEVLKTSRVVCVFQVLWIMKKQNLRLYSLNIAYQQYWSSENFALNIVMFKIKSLNFKFSKNQKQLLGGVLLKRYSWNKKFAKIHWKISVIQSL